MPLRLCRRAALGALVWLTIAAPARAEAPQAPPRPTEVSITLVLALDASGSVSNDRFELQKQGYAAAFRNPQVVNAIRSLDTGSIAVTMMQWTGPLLHVVAVDWTLIKDAATANGFAAAIMAAPRQLFGGGTSISGAIDYSRLLLAQSPFHGARRVVDISGDGANNRGRPVMQARDEAVHDGIGINGLPILALEPDLDRYYYDNVIGGPGAFMVPAADYDAFADAILKKLINEIANRNRTPNRHRHLTQIKAWRHKLGQVCAEASRPVQASRIKAMGLEPCGGSTATRSIRRRWSFSRPPSTKPG